MSLFLFRGEEYRCYACCSYGLFKPKITYGTERTALDQYSSLENLTKWNAHMVVKLYWIEVANYIAT